MIYLFTNDNNTNRVYPFFEYSLASSSTIASISFSLIYWEFNIAFLIIIVIILSGDLIHIRPFIPIAISYEKCLPNAFNTIQLGNKRLWTYNILDKCNNKPLHNSPYIVSLVVHSFFDPKIMIIVNYIIIIIIIIIIIND